MVPIETLKKDSLKKYAARAGMSAVMAHGGSLTLARWALEKGAVLSEHSHPHEQITHIVSGRMSFAKEDGGSFIAEAGDFIVFAPNETHGAVVLEDTVAVDAFCPVREDFKREMESGG